MAAPTYYRTEESQKMQCVNKHLLKWTNICNQRKKCKEKKRIIKIIATINYFLMKSTLCLVPGLVAKTFYGWNEVHRLLFIWK